MRHSLEIAALVAAKTGDRDRGRITSLAQSLEKEQIRRGSLAGLWNYGVRDKAGAGDNSNTQFALFGLHAAAVAGIPIQRETWERSCDHFVEFQNNDGGWGYRNGNPSTGSMTCGAIASLALCDQMLVASRPPDGQITPGDGDEKKSRREIALKRGIGWMSRYFTIGTNPGQGGTWQLYYLFEMSRAGRLSGQALFGTHDWYREGATYLIDGQSIHDGSWQTYWGARPNRTNSRDELCPLIFFRSRPAAINRSRSMTFRRTSGLPPEQVGRRASRQQFVGAKADRQRRIKIRIPSKASSTCCTRTRFTSVRTARPTKGRAGRRGDGFRCGEQSIWNSQARAGNCQNGTATAATTCRNWLFPCWSSRLNRPRTRRKEVFRSSPRPRDTVTRGGGR